MSEKAPQEGNSGQNEDPETVAGAVGGVTGIGAGAGLGLSLLGPIGAVIGALAGAMGGWWTGKGVLNAVEEVDRADDRFRRAHEHAGATGPFDEVRHSYQLGYIAGRNPQYADMSFAEIEDDLRGAWVQAHLHDRDPVPWEAVRDGVMRGYEVGRADG